MKIDVYDWPCGFGKTTAVIEKMLANPGPYLLAVPRLDDITERRCDIARIALEMGVKLPTINEIRSTDGGGTRSVENVRRAISMEPSNYSEREHAIVICSHAGLMAADLSTYEGWHLVVDETIQVLDHRSECTPDLWQVYNRHYSLTPLTEDWAEVRPKPESAPDRLRRNTGLPSNFLLFDRLARSSSGLFASLMNWSDSDDCRIWDWFSVWSPPELNAFASVTVTAANFSETLTAKIWQSVCQDLHLVHALRPVVSWAPRPVLIQFFADEHIARTSVWKSLSGEPVRRVLQWIKANTRQPHFWAGNKEHIPEKLPDDLRPPGDRISTKIAGSNNYQGHHCCSIIYTAKPDNHERQVLELFGIKENEVQRAREHEDLLQFVMRSSIRDRNSTASVTIRVYDRQQAEFLAAHLPVPATLQHIDLGLDELVAASKPKTVSRVATMTPEQKAAHQRALARERKRKHRAAQREVTANAGSIPRRGRPPKSSAKAVATGITKLHSTI